MSEEANTSTLNLMLEFFGAVANLVKPSRTNNPVNDGIENTISLIKLFAVVMKIAKKIDYELGQMSQHPRERFKGMGVAPP